MFPAEQSGRGRSPTHGPDMDCQRIGAGGWCGPQAKPRTRPPAETTRCARRLSVDRPGQVCWADQSNGKIVSAPRAKRRGRCPLSHRSAHPARISSDQCKSRCAAEGTIVTRKGEDTLPWATMWPRWNLARPRRVPSPSGRRENRAGGLRAKAGLPAEA